MRQAMLTVAIVATAMLAGGCGSKNAYQTVAVSGTIKYDDGSTIPAARIELQFVPQAAEIDIKTKPKLGVAEVNVEDGSFEVASTYDYGDGLVVGKHKVLAAALAEPVGYLDSIPPEFRDIKKTSLEVDTSNKPFEIVIPKP